jgi:uncharacterized membrane protein YbhN (UPF0104 family)
LAACGDSRDLVFAPAERFINCSVSRGERLLGLFTALSKAYEQSFMPLAWSRMKRVKDFIWPAIGLIAVAVSLRLLFREFHGDAVGAQVWAAISAITPAHYVFAILSTILAYTALAWYDRIALQHLGITSISVVFIALCSFTTYALSHNIGASVFSGAVVRYRAYSSKGLSAPQVAVLVALCSLTFFLGTLLLGGLVLVLEPGQLSRLDGLLPQFLTNTAAARFFGTLCLMVVAAYIAGSILQFKPLVIGGFRIDYPKWTIALRQFIAAPLELLGAAGIIYFALPEAGNPGYFAVLAVFLASFSAALISNAPGGLGVFELLFIEAMPGIPKTGVLAALLVFRLFYLLVPLVFAAIVVTFFERRKYKALSNLAG